MADLNLADLLRSYEAGGRWRVLPQSTNIDDRRNGSALNSLGDLAQKAALYLTGNPVPWHKANPIFPSGDYGPDISNSVDRIRLETLLKRNGDKADSDVRLGAYFSSGNPEVAQPSPLLDNRR